MSVQVLSCSYCGGMLRPQRDGGAISCPGCGSRVARSAAGTRSREVAEEAPRRSRSSVRHREQAVVKKRMEVVFLGFLGVTMLLAVRLIDLQGVKGRGFVRLASAMHGRTRTIDAQRGKVKDRSGTELAQDVPGRALAINPRLVGDPSLTAARLAELLHLEDAERDAIRDRIARAKGKKLAYSQLQRGLDRKLAERVLALAKKDPLLKGLSLEDSPVRVYPAGRDGLQLVGAVSGDGRGIEGIEYRFDSVLSGKDGEKTIRVDATGAPIPGSQTRLTEPVNGRDVTLTIDRDIQHFVEEELAKVQVEQAPDAATAVVMDVRTGDILGMASTPTFKPQDRKVTSAQRRTRAITDLFEPGSIFKVVTAAAALEHGVDTHIQCSGSRTIGRRTVRCAHNAHGSTDLRKMIEASCNISAGALAERVGAEKMYHFLDNFGFQSKTGIEFAGEATGRLEAPEKWATMRTVNIGFGQGIVATPIQMVSAYAAIANDGVYNPPRLVLKAPGAELPRREPRRVMSPENAAKLRDYMQSVVVGDHGTGKAAKIPGYTVAGKTGTAQIAKNGRYGNGFVASFVGFVPASKPRLAILVSVWHPRRGHYGGVVSAPVFREIARQSVAFLGIPPDAPTDARDGAVPGSFRRVARNGGDSPND